MAIVTMHAAVAIRRALTRLLATDTLILDVITQLTVGTAIGNIHNGLACVSACRRDITAGEIELNRESAQRSDGEDDLGIVHCERSLKGQIRILDDVG